MESISKSPQHELSTSHGEIQEIKSPVRNLRRAVSVASEQHTMSIESEASSDAVISAKAGPASYKKHYTNKKSKTWQASYNKVFVCRLCDKHCKSRGNINAHFKAHKNLINNNRDCFKKYCTINLKKKDCKPNITGSLDNVVLKQDKIVCDEGKMHYYVLYTLNEECREVVIESDSSDDFMPTMKAKRRRLLSRSSTDTVILNDAKTHESSDHEVTKSTINEAQENVPNVMECIDLDDSSIDSIHDDSSMPPTSDINLTDTTHNKCADPQLADHKTILKLVSACQNKYLKKIECSEEQEKQFASNKSKLLNIGLKAIFHQGYKSTGLLRYLEHEHLEIRWLPINAALRSHSKENKYVRIMPRVKVKEDTNQDGAQWKKITNHNFILMKEGAKPIPIQKRKSFPILDSLLMSNTNTSSVLNGHSKCDSSPSDSAVLYSKTSIDPDKKLLNASPVANPKQLPKKAVPIETKASSVCAVTEAIVVPSPVAREQIYCNPLPMSVDAEDLTNEDIGNDNFCMPIITSTTSLAPGNETTYYLDDAAGKTENNATPNNSLMCKSDEAVEKSSASPSKKPAAFPSNKPAATVTPAPRIKVKNVAELMSEQALSQQNAVHRPQPNIWFVPLENTLQTHVTNVSVNNLCPSNGVQTLAQPTTSSQVINSLNNLMCESVILDTVEMPNARTTSPFKYLQTLMQLHNISLLDGTEELPKEFICLIKFKLQFSQQTIHKPVVLCLSLHCLGNKFFLGVKDPTHPGNIDLNKLSANWQWEILKIYTVRELVVNKLYQNAEKTSPAVFANVKIFVNILQSIKFKTCST